MIIWLFLGALALLVVALFIYWAVVLTEGAYFGKWAVRAIYDWGAPTYDEVKQYDDMDEFWFLANPLAGRLEERFGPHALVLDVATGTGRLPLALCRALNFDGHVVGLDLSLRMLAEAEHKTSGFARRVSLIHHPAQPLPFADNSFDAVTMLEALEFVPNPDATLCEIVRVLTPGGLLLITNRIGRDALWFPGRGRSPARFEQLLQALGLVDVEIKPWQEYYDLVFAAKPGTATRRVRGEDWRNTLLCPSCETLGAWYYSEGGLSCRACGTQYERAGRILEFTT